MCVEHVVEVRTGISKHIMQMLKQCMPANPPFIPLNISKKLEGNHTEKISSTTGF